MKKVLKLLTLFLLIQTALPAAKSLNQVPYAGLVLDTIEVDGVEISKFKFENDKKFIVVKPGQEVSCYLHYDVDADDLETLHRHHLVLGFYKVGPQECVFSSLGIKDKKGNAAVKLTAPKEEGIYELRAAMGKGLTCSSAQEEWSKNSSTNSVLGFVVVQK